MNGFTRQPKQFPPGLLVATLLVASGLLWAIMFFGPLARLSQLARGLKPFDIRPTGYSYDEARAFLDAIGPRGRDYYLNPELIIDTIYPPLYAVSRGLALWWLTTPGRIRPVPLPLSIRYTLVAIPVAMASFDTFENGCIAVMLWTWPQLSHAVVAVSSFMTQVKIGLGVLTEVSMGGLALMSLLRWMGRISLR